MNSNYENKCTFFPWTFKVEENKVHLFFGSDAFWGRYEPFVIFLLEGFFGTFRKRQNYHNSPGWTLIMKISALLFLQLSKLKKIKCLYFLDQTPFEGDMSLFSFFTCEGFTGSFRKQQNYYKSPGWSLIVKISTLLFLELLKLKKIKCLYFLDQTPFEGDLSLLSVFDLRGFPVPLENDKIAITHQDELWSRK